MIVELTYFCIFWLNVIHSSATIVPNTTLRIFMAGKTIDYNVYYNYEFGTYVQIHKEHDNTIQYNTIQTRTVDAITLRPTGNVQGGNFTSV